MATRIRLVISIGLVALSTAGCSTLIGADHTVDVDGQGYTSIEADALFDEYFAKSEIFGTTPLDSGGFGDADRARLLLNSHLDRRRHGVTFVLTLLGPLMTVSISADYQPPVRYWGHVSRPKLFDAQTANHVKCKNHASTQLAAVRFFSNPAHADNGVWFLVRAGIRCVCNACRPPR